MTVQGITFSNQISSGFDHACAITSDSSVKCWGNNSYGQLGISASNSNYPTSVSGIVAATDVSAGEKHTCSILSDRSVKCWGKNDYGQLGDGTTVDSFSPVTVRF